HRARQWVISILNRYSLPMTVLYDGHSAYSRTIAETLRRLDVLGRLDVIELSKSADLQHQEGLPSHLGVDAVSVLSNKQWLTGNQALNLIAARLPWLWCFYPIWVVRTHLIHAGGST